MEALAKFNPGHDDLVHDLAFDFYGTRLATCSSDQRIKVWDMVDKDSKDGQADWTLNDSWKAHDSAVLKVCWAHPEYGQLLSSCSFDRSVRIWEEQDTEPLQSEKRWIEKARLVDSRGTVQDIEFAPRHVGLRLATISVDGNLRIYEAMDVINVAHWTLMEDVEIVPATKERDTEFCLSWCKSRFLPPTLVVGCGVEQGVKIFRYDDAAKKWTSMETLAGHADIVHDVSWAPSIGRSYQLVATACKDRKVRIFSLTPGKDAVFEVKLLAELGDHDTEVWRVEWNLTGTILASSGDDGKMLLWKSNFLGEWNRMAELSSHSINNMIQVNR